jgi:zinc protease
MTDSASRHSPASVILVLAALAGTAAFAAGPKPPAAAAKPAAAAQQVRGIEGVTEYRLANGLQVLLYPDQSSSTVTINVTYKVGSRHESYGETGMAHLLEHMNFKGTPTHPKIMDQ